LFLKLLFVRFLGYKIRNLLAAIDFNEHRDRPVKKGPDGEPKYA